MLPLTIEITDQHGRQWRPPYRNLKYAKTFYGGEDLWCTFILDRDASIDYPDAGYGNDVIARNGLAPRFTGEIRQIESDLETVTVKVLGRFVYLDDYGYGGQGKLWSESRYGKWRPVTWQQDTAFWPVRYEMNNRDSLYIAPRKGEVFTLGAFFGAYHYWSPYDNIVRVSFDYRFVDPDNWMVFLESNPNPPYDAAFNVIEWSIAATSTGVKDITLSVPSPLLTFRLAYTNLPQAQYTGETGAGCFVVITNLRLWGEDGPLSLAIESPSVIHIAEDIVGQVEAATPISAEEELVQESIFVRDTFTDGNGTSLDVHGPDIDKQRGFWTEALGNWDIQGNEANLAGSPGLAIIGAGVSDGVVYLDVYTAPTDITLGIVFRYQDLNNFWHFRLQPVAGRWQLYRWDAGVPNLIDQAVIGIEYDYWYNLMVKLRGDRIDCYIGGIWRTGLNNNTFQDRSEHGFRADQVGSRLDNFEVFQALPLWPLFYEGGESCHKALVDASSYGDWDFRALGWGIEPGGDRLYLRRADRSRVRYVIPPRHASRLSARGQTDKGFVTEAWGKYIDEDGVERWTEKYYAHVTPTGIVANTTATGDDLASTIYGVIRERTINFGREDAGLAVEYLRQYLEEHAHPQIKSSFEVFGPVRDMFKGGAWIQPRELEMGYLVQIPHFRAVEVVGLADSDIRWDVGGGSDTTFLLVAMQYDAERGKAKLIPEGASEDLGRLMKYSRDVERGQEKSLIDKRREASFSR